MSSYKSLWTLVITGMVIAATFWFQLQQPAITPPSKIQSTQPQSVVNTQPRTTELPPELSMLQDPLLASSKPKKVKPPLQDPAARAALGMVGKDAAAEQIWQEAINNSDLPKGEREDLIEDLNEEGFSNGNKVTRADLPLIEARLKIIERLMPEAIDQTNLDAFGEARKDLIILRAKLSQ